MSQHYFNTTQGLKPVQVMLGWDRPLGHYFMVIEQQSEVVSTTEEHKGDTEEDDEDDEGYSYLYSNLNEKDAFGLGLEHFRGVLRKFGIHVPEQMFTQVEIDRAYNVGNRYVTYQADGTFTEG